MFHEGRCTTFFMSHMDYRTLLQVTLVKYCAQQLQTIQNAAACPVSDLPQFPSSPPHRWQPTLPPHWLLVAVPKFQILVLVFSAPQGITPALSAGSGTCQPVLCAVWHSSPSTPCASHVIASPSLDSSFYCSLIVKCPPTPGGTAELLHILYCEKCRFNLNSPIFHIRSLHLLFLLFLFTGRFLACLYLTWSLQDLRNILLSVIRSVYV